MLHFYKQRKKKSQLQILFAYFQGLKQWSTNIVKHVKSTFKKTVISSNICLYINKHVHIIWTRCSLMKQKIWCHSCLINLQAVCRRLNEKTGRMMAFRKRGRERECGWLPGLNMPTFNLAVDTSQLHKSTYSPDYCWSCGENLIRMEIRAADSVLWESEIIKITDGSPTGYRSRNTASLGWGS